VLADTLAEGLRDDGLAVDLAFDGEQGAEKARFTDYDVILLDRDLPRLHGDVLCRQLIAEGISARILMLTAAGSLDDRVEGLELGADDYLPKPFAFPELVARIRSLARRPGRATPPVLERSGIRLDPARRMVTRDGRPIRLTLKEFAVLEILLASDGALVSAEQLIERAWDEALDPFSNVVRITVARLRRKLGRPDPIVTEVGAGYKIP
jgi:DNA-binding response OmpR family regulator